MSEHLGGPIIARVISLGGLYQLSYSVLYGTTIYTTCISGPLLRRILPRKHLVAFQHEALPAYFNLSIVLSSTCFGIWSYFHSEVLSNLFNPTSTNVTQAYMLLTTLAVHAADTFIVGPATHEIILERWHLEEKEGKKYDAADVSNELKAVNKRFAKWHFVSASINSVAMACLTFHGLWIGTKGLW
jgi:hypothetical protein